MVEVSGVVTRANGKTPLADAFIVFAPADKSRPAGPGFPAVSTDAAGGFALLSPIHAGTYTVCVSVDPDPVVLQTVTLDAHKSAAVFHFRAAAASMEGTVIDTFGKPSDHVAVGIVDFADHIVYKVKTDENGHYSFPSILPGKYILLATNRDPNLFKDRPEAPGGWQAYVERSVLVTDKPIKMNIQLHPAPFRKDDRSGKG